MTPMLRRLLDSTLTALAVALTTHLVTIVLFAAINGATLEVLTTFGDGGRQPGQFYGVHSVATDSQGNLYTTETYEGKRVQKFVYMGLGSAPRDQGVVWPTRD